MTMRNLGYAVECDGRLEEAEKIYRQRWRIAHDAYGEEHRIALETMSGLASFLFDYKRYAEAEALYRKALDVRARTFGWDHDATLRSRRDLAKLLKETGRAEEAARVAPPASASGQR